MSQELEQGSKLVVYVDDEFTNRFVIEKTFGRTFELLTLASAEEAISLFAKQPVAVLLTDQRMPGTQGDELLRWVRSRHPATVCIVVTAYRELDQILRVVNEGLVSRYVLKPWDPIELGLVIRWGLETHELMRRDAAIAHRLKESERLITLGSIAAGMLQDASAPVPLLGRASTDLSHLADRASLLETIAERQSLTPPSDEERAELVRIARELRGLARSVRDGTAVIGGLLEGWYRFVGPSGHGAVEADPGPVIRQAMAICQHLVENAGALLSYEGTTILPQVKIDAAELTQVLVNLLTNASQALLAARAPNAHVILAAHEELQAVRFSVTDNGTGISAESMPRVGTLFFSTKANAAGFGLAQCRHLISRSGGRLEISSVDGAGTTVSFTVPKARQDAG